ncbi:alpha/beta fold hydrolase [Amycolatopsis sp. WQ 127309]|uniref:alpha/beta fold hydrolase n=1 Tax=Amycolatopsis sp. WQ 127309 TaxID=2932773 RepID=UPI001FF164A7|nr:alpha/beta hydrolase [Amycolatopsis sp. WQ 127309]UOZ06755.1 alpha/beta fold hydrolase [Amycolatopsis sp. WQ 127309]
MARAQANGLELEYGTFGDPAAPPLVLVMGLGAQMITWDDGFCELLASRGFFVVRYDNRDVGLSTYFDELPPPDLGALFAGDRSSAPYLLADLADDAVGLFDALGIAKAHVVGASMGGMIVQQLAIDHPDRLLSVTSIMSTTGDPAVGQAEPWALAVLTRPPATTREQALADSVEGYRRLGSPGYPDDDAFLLAKATMRFDRARHPEGTLRHAAAVMASGDRTSGLHSVELPALVVHGDADPLIDVSGGKATAAAIPGAELLVIPGMGHNLPRAVWPEVADAIGRVTGQ